jgi:hypothetical protein
VDFISLFKQKFRQIGPVLAGDAGDKGFFIHSASNGVRGARGDPQECF